MKGRRDRSACGVPPTGREERPPAAAQRGPGLQADGTVVARPLFAVRAR